ncbi:putative bifunctional diguanylate cyclase/phosphodiesterase [Reinekea sp. G2M2-21]|uniref:putative bifunctional diguanylate cyclase/phosphodiesterase n=1 Tax=Reinekea sp. G2M2-21 TaxID=2788942 RepID=UPI00351C992F
MAHEKWQLEQDITKALNAHDFTLHFQPIFDLKSNRCIAAEALIRWPGTDLRPDQFIPLAEETGLIHTIGIWVLEAAIRQFFEWKQAGGAIDYISINLSVIQLKDKNFFDNLDAILSRFPIETGQVVLEITESVMMNSDASTVKKLNGLRERGFSLAIDDFGTGFSSLNYLKHLPINYLKVDRSFIKGVPNNPHDTVICEAIIQMSLAMELTIIAEGVEMPHQMNWLASKGVLCAQGYFYAHPVSAKDFQPYIGI